MMVEDMLLVDETHSGSGSDDDWRPYKKRHITIGLLPESKQARNTIPSQADRYVHFTMRGRSVTPRHEHRSSRSRSPHTHPPRPRSPVQGERVHPFITPSPFLPPPTDVQQPHSSADTHPLSSDGNPEQGEQGLVQHPSMTAESEPSVLKPASVSEANGIISLPQSTATRPPATTSLPDSPPHSSPPTSPPRALLPTSPPRSAPPASPPRSAPPASPPHSPPPCSPSQHSPLPRSPHYLSLSRPRSLSFRDPIISLDSASPVSQ